MCLHISPLLFLFQLLQYCSGNLAALFVHWHKMQHLHRHMFVSSFNDTQSWPGSLHMPLDIWHVTMGSSVSPPCWIYGSLSLTPHDIAIIRLRINPELCLDSSYPNLCTWLFVGRLHVLLFLHFYYLHQLLSKVLDCLWVLLTLYLPCKTHHFGLHQLTSSLSNMNRLYIIALLCDHLVKIRYCSIKFLSIIFWLGQDNIDCCLQLSSSDFWRKWMTSVPSSMPT